MNLKLLVYAFCIFTLALLVFSQKRHLTTEKLALVIEVSRHGARSPNAIFDLALNSSENFKNKSELMQYGRYQHFKMGQYIREKYVDRLKFLAHAYDEREVYVQTTYLNRTYLSALYQLMGMYPDNKADILDYEKYEIGYEDYLTPVQRREGRCRMFCDQNFLIHQVNATYDYLLHLDKKNCKRFKLLHDIVKKSEEYNDIIWSYIDDFGPHLSKLTGIPEFNQKKITQVCNYVQWAYYSNITLKFNMSDNEYKYCLAIGDSKQYFNAYGFDEVWKVAAFEFINQLEEFVDIVQKNAHFEDKPFWQKYFKMHFHQNQQHSKHPVFPLFIHYAAHAETLGVFFAGLGIEKYARVKPGGALFIEFFREGHDYYVRFILKDSHDEPEQLLQINGMDGYKYEVNEFKSWLYKRMLSEGKTPDYLELECLNLEPHGEQAVLKPSEKTIESLRKHYDLQPIQNERRQKKQQNIVSNKIKEETSNQYTQQHQEDL